MLGKHSMENSLKAGMRRRVFEVARKRLQKWGEGTQCADFEEWGDMLLGWL